MIQHYDEAYKREVIAKTKASGNVSQTARELGISSKCLHTWIKAYRESSFPRKRTTCSRMKYPSQVESRIDQPVVLS
jgi:transposase-like protein